MSSYPFNENEKIPKNGVSSEDLFRSLLNNRNDLLADLIAKSTLPTMERAGVPSSQSKDAAGGSSPAAADLAGIKARAEEMYRCSIITKSDDDKNKNGRPAFRSSDSVPGAVCHRLQMQYQDDFLRALMQRIADAAEIKGGGRYSEGTQAQGGIIHEARSNRHLDLYQVQGRESSLAQVLVEQLRLQHVQGRSFSQAQALENIAMHQRQEKHQRDVAAARLNGPPLFSSLVSSEGFLNTASTAAAARQLSDEELQTILEQYRRLSYSSSSQVTAQSPDALLLSLLASKSSLAPNQEAPLRQSGLTTGQKELLNHLQQLDAVERQKAASALLLRQREALLHQRGIDFSGGSFKFGSDPNPDRGNESILLPEVLTLQEEVRQQQNSLLPFLALKQSKPENLIRMIEQQVRRPAVAAHTANATPANVSSSLPSLMNRIHSQPIRELQQQPPYGQQGFPSTAESAEFQAPGKASAIANPTTPSMVIADALRHNKELADAARMERIMMTTTSNNTTANDGLTLDDCQDDDVQGRRKTFPERLMEVLSMKETQHVICWLPHGKSFMIFHPDEFAAKIMPAYFKQAKYASFTRKLNRWGFRQSVEGAEQGAFHHKLFLRDHPLLCLKMFCGGTAYPLSKRKRHPVVKATGEKTSSTVDLTVKTAAVESDGDANYAAAERKETSGADRSSEPYLIAMKHDVQENLKKDDPSSKNDQMHPRQESHDGRGRSGSSAKLLGNQRCFKRKEIATEGSQNGRKDGESNIFPPLKKRPVIGRSA